MLAYTIYAKTLSTKIKDAKLLDNYEYEYYSDISVIQNFKLDINQKDTKHKFCCTEIKNFFRAKDTLNFKTCYNLEEISIKKYWYL